MRRLLPLVGGGFDQLVSAATNLLFALVAARLLSSSDFGRFSIAALTYSLIGLLTYSLVTEPAIRATRSRNAVADRTLSAAYSTCTLIGFGGLVVGSAIALSGPDRLMATIATVLVGALGVSLHETQRVLEISFGRIKTATALDASWLVLSSGVLGCLVVVGRAPTTPSQLIAVWFSGAWLSSLSLCVVRGVPPWALRRAASFVWHHRHAGAAFSLEGLLGIALAQATLLLMASRFGYEFVASVALVQLAFSSASFATSAVRTLGQHRYAARHAVGFGAQRSVYITCAIVSLIAGLNGLMLVVMPDAIGQLAFGQRWAHLEGLAAIGTIYTIGRSVTAAPVLALRVIGKGGLVLTLRVLTGLMQVLAVLVAKEVGISGTGNLLTVLSVASLAVASVWLLAFGHLRPKGDNATTRSDPTSESADHDRRSIT